MSDPVETLRAFGAAIEQGKPTVAADLFAPDATYEEPPRRHCADAPPSSPSSQTSPTATATSPSPSRAPSPTPITRA